MHSTHDEDELYLVHEGPARLRIEEEVHPIERAPLMYVRTASKHDVFDVEQDLTVLAFFGTAAYGLV